jgi:hypothetical protein
MPVGNNVEAAGSLCSPAKSRFRALKAAGGRFYALSMSALSLSVNLQRRWYQKLYAN